MYINNEDFETWMQKLSKKLSEIGQDLKSLINTKEVFSEDETLLDNQDLAFLLKVSFRTLQRYRSSKKLPFFMVGHKTYYRTSDVREFVRSHMDFQTYQEFEKKHPKSKDKDKNEGNEE
ncbi:MAG: helix-turn-helix domain-containing protein [Dysgonomonas sp.]|uniref:helix-turn-helix domain-containing protein n=1 Tax=Dysgonomonas sp. TaxID=1891233 RepID=UPI002580CC0A|nr:helix-turn-helix domain-containing protein [Dysgonomonas sp.]MBS7120322.1 helix-turn-helix domain-containing protein [Dysgonomonas sp.]